MTFTPLVDIQFHWAKVRLSSSGGGFEKVSYAEAVRFCLVVCWVRWLGCVGSVGQFHEPLPPAPSVSGCWLGAECMQTFLSRTSVEPAQECRPDGPAA